MCYPDRAVPGSWTPGLTWERQPARGSGEERAGVRRGKGLFPGPLPPGLPCPSSLWLFWLLGNIFREREVALPDAEPSPAAPRRAVAVPRTGKVRLAGAGRPGCSPTSASRRRPGEPGALPPPRDKTPRVSHGRVGLRAPRRSPVALGGWPAACNPSGSNPCLILFAGCQPGR